MKTLKEKKGFTLIELLAVIVVLAIVMVLATTTVLPYMTEARQETFALEVDAAKVAATNAVSLIMIGKLDEDYYSKITDGYCFTIEDLRKAGLYEKDDENYIGIVTATKQSGSNGYTYSVSMKNNDYYVTSATGNIDKDKISDVTDTTEVPTACPAN